MNCCHYLKMGASRLHSWSGLIAGTLISIVSLASAAETFPVVGDTYTKDNNATTNYGSASVVRVQNWANITGFAIFDLASSTQLSTDIAFLKIPADSTRKPGVIEIYEVQSAWSESTLSHSTRPGLAPVPVATFLVSGAGTGQEVSIDITPLVNKWLANTSTNFGLALVPTNVNFWAESREASQGMYIETIDLTPTPTPGNRFPADGDVDISRNPTLDLTCSSTSLVAAQFQMSALSNFNSLSYDSGILFDDICSHRASANLADLGTYYWRGRQRLENGAWSDWSSVTVFAVGNSSTLALNVFQDGALGYTGARDTDIRGSGVNPQNVIRDWNQGGQGVLRTGRRPTGSSTDEVYRTLLKFDVSALSNSGAVVNVWIELTGWQHDDISHNQDVHLVNSAYALRKAWGEGSGITDPPSAGDANWLYTQNPQLWTSPGASSASDTAPSADRSATPVVTSRPRNLAGRKSTWSSRELLQLVKSWIDSPSGNYGLLLKANDESIRLVMNFASREHPDSTFRPRLIIESTETVATPDNVAPVANAGSDMNATVGNMVSLTGSVSDDGLPNPPATTSAAWSTISGPGTASFANSTNPTSGVSFDTSGVYILRLTASDGELQHSDDVAVTVVDQPSGQSLFAVQDTFVRDNAANNNFGSEALVRVQNWGNGTGFVRFDLSSYPSGSTVGSAILEVSVNTVKLGGSISVHKVLGNWDELALTNTNRPALGPAVTSFSVTSANNGKTVQVDITALFNQLLADRANDFGIALTPENVNLWINSREAGSPMQVVADAGGPVSNAAPVANAGSDLSVTVNGSVSLNGTVSDDGLPNPPATTSSTWTKVSGPGIASFNNASNPTSSVSFDTTGSYVLRLTANDGEFQHSDTVTVTVVEPSTQQSFFAAQDSFTRDNSRNTNYGSETLVRVQNWGNSTGFVRFDLSSYPSGSAVGSATLEIHVDTVKLSGNVTVHKVLGGWDELTLTHANKPALGPVVTSFNVTSGNSGQTVPVDITTLFNQLLADPSRNFGIALNRGNVNLWISSRESGSPITIRTGSSTAMLNAVADNFTTLADTTLNGDVIADNGNGTDSPGQPPTTAQLMSSPANGQLGWIGDGTFEYIPNTGFSGSDSFSYSLLDSSGSTSNIAQARISVGSAVAGTPNVLFFYADDMGWGDLQTYNAQSLIDMPNIERLANEGISFMDAHAAAAKCAPSRYSALTGNYHWRGRWPWGQWNYRGGSQIRTGQQTLGDMLQSVGYVTASIGKQHLGGDFYLKGSNATARTSDPDSEVDFGRRMRNGPLDRGFDHSYLVLRGIQTWPYAYFKNDRMVGDPADLLVWNSGSYGSSTISKTGIGMPYWNSSKVGQDLVQAAIDFIDDHHQANINAGTNVPFFMYYASQSAHSPYTPPNTLLGVPVKGVTGMNKHTDMLYEIDVAFGALVSKLEALNLADNTLIIFASDNGGIPNETLLGHDSVGGLRGRKGQIHEGGHRVPLIFKWGDGSAGGSVISPGTQSNQLVAVQDIVATVANIVGVSLATDQALDSFDMSPVLMGQQKENNPIRTSVVMEADEDIGGSTAQHFAIRNLDWKLIFDENRNPVELFDLNSDLSETTNRVNDSAQQQRVQDMTNLLNSTINSVRTAP